MYVSNGGSTNPTHFRYGDWEKHHQHSYKDLHCSQLACGIKSRPLLFQSCTQHTATTRKQINLQHPGIWDLNSLLLQCWLGDNATYIVKSAAWGLLDPFTHLHRATHEQQRVKEDAGNPYMLQYSVNGLQHQNSRERIQEKGDLAVLGYNTGVLFRGYRNTQKHKSTSTLYNHHVHEYSMLLLRSVGNNEII
jgi:hypothetical protein